MAQAAGIGVLEDHHVTGLQIRLGNVGALLVHIHDHTGHLVAQRVVDIVHKAGAVKACGGGAAPLIGSSQELLGKIHNLLTGKAGGGGAVVAGAAVAAAVEGFGAGLGAGGLAAPVEQGRVGGGLIFVGVLGQGEKIAADIADVVAENHPIPAVFQAQDVGGVALGAHGDHIVIGAGALAQVHTVAGDLTVAQLGMTGVLDVQVIAVHVAFLQIMNDLVPVAVLADDDHNVILGGAAQHCGRSGGTAAQNQVGGGDKADAIHQTVVHGFCGLFGLVLLGLGLLGGRGGLLNGRLGGCLGGRNGLLGLFLGLALQRIGAGGDAGGLAALVEQGLIVGFCVFVGDLGQIHIVAADVADLLTEDHLVPAAADAQYVNLVAGIALGHGGIVGAGAGAHIYVGAVDLAVAKLGILGGLNTDVILVHVARGQVVNNMVPVSGLADDHHNFILGGYIEDFGAGGGLLAQPQIGTGGKADAVHNGALGMGFQGNGAEKQHHRQNQRQGPFGEFHTLPSVLRNRKQADYLPARARSSQTQPRSRAVYRPSFSLFLTIRSRLLTAGSVSCS